MKAFFWLIWLTITGIIVAIIGYLMFESEDKSAFLIGHASHGHYQIELACEACHSEAFGGTEVLQDACMNCHAEELEMAHDSHPESKFTDPRNADRLEVVDARYCISCHKEHQKENTLEMGLTLPKDYCFHCHKDVGEERESHQSLAFDSCASAGCHNYHDNRALYEDFLVEHANQAWLSNGEQFIKKLHAEKPQWQTNKAHHKAAFSKQAAAHPDIVAHWAADAHGMAGVQCGGCHSDETNAENWIDKPSIDQCASCHNEQATQFTQGKHGMRIAQGMPGITTDSMQSSLSFTESSAEQPHSCNSCHSAHQFDTRYAATEACLDCHTDEHSIAFKQSPHASVSLHDLSLASVSHDTDKQEAALAADESMSCASCHMPRKTKTVNGKTVFSVQHNQNDNLRPNEKMIRSVCLDCHSLEFSIDALADPTLIRNNFSGKPEQHIPSIDWALERVK